MRTGWLLAACAASAVGAAIITLLVVASYPKPQVPLTAGLDGTWVAMTQEFDRRLHTRFPVGSPEIVMTDELRLEGFARDDWRYVQGPGIEAEAMRWENDAICNIVARVYWRADGRGRLTSIRGLYGEEGCL